MKPGYLLDQNLDGCRGSVLTSLKQFLCFTSTLCSFIPVWRCTVCSHMDQRITHHVLQFHCKMLAGSWNNPWRSVLDLKILGCQEILIAYYTGNILAYSSLYPYVLRTQYVTGIQLMWAKWMNEWEAYNYNASEANDSLTTNHSFSIYLLRV